MLRNAMIAVFALLLFPAVALADSVTATIDGNCSLKSATITVPAGKTATGFSVASLQAGSKCKVGGTPDSKGWGISQNGTKKYYWSQFKSNAPSEVGGPLNQLTLGAGTYTVFVDGGSGAKAVINYTVK